jgi:cyclopropane-fatty-acyl-phospholipid synthase
VTLTSAPPAPPSARPAPAGLDAVVALAEGGWVPDPLLRHGIRRLLRQRLADEEAGGPEATAERLRRWVETCRTGPVAIETDAANDQHYRVPPEFFVRVLGPRLKYSCALFPAGVDDLAVAEEAMLSLTAERARLADGQEILELGCGWGSLTLWMAERFPRARILAVSNSPDQRGFIEARARERGLGNVEVVTADVNRFSTDRTFDRVVSVEMFEHLRNYEEAMGRVAGWLRPGGLFFVHIFVHRQVAYPFEARDVSDWMSRHFFTGGQMPSDDLLLHFQDRLRIVDRWRVSGEHYRKTSEAWLAKLDAARDDVLALFRREHGPDEARRRFHRWRIFFLACAELFGFRGGGEWFVGHYLFARRSES